MDTLQEIPTLPVKTLLLLFIFIGIGMVLTKTLTTSGRARAQEKPQSQHRDRIVVRKPWPVEPVKVVAVRTKNKTDLDTGKAFDEDDDWLDGFTVTVANNSGKVVTAMRDRNDLPQRARQYQAATYPCAAFWP